MLSLGAAPSRAAELTHEFRGGRFDPQMFRLMGETDSTRIYPDQEGLRLTLPATTPPLQPTGVGTRVRLRGDFDISAAFEVLDVGKPKTGYGAGFSIYASLDSPAKDAVSIAWYQRPKEGAIFAGHYAGNDPAGKRRHKVHLVKTAGRAGKLRLTRQGEKVTFWVADGADEAFREIWRVEHVSGDVTLARFAADNGGAAVPLDVRLHEIDIRADAFIGVVDSTLSAQTLLLLLGAGSIGVAGVVWAVRRKQEQAVAREV